MNKAYEIFQMMHVGPQYAEEFQFKIVFKYMCFL